MSVWVCYGSGGWDYTGDEWPSYSLYFILCVHNQANTIREQQMKQTQLGSSWVWPCKTSAHQRHYRTRVLSRGATPGLLWRRRDLSISSPMSAVRGELSVPTMAGTQADPAGPQQLQQLNPISCSLQLLITYHLQLLDDIITSTATLPYMEDSELWTFHIRQALI